MSARAAGEPAGVRLLLDAHVSGPRIARALRERGHDVRAADEERGRDGWSDEDLLALASQEERIMVTFDVKDFPGIVGRWSETQRQHAGCMILVGIDHSEFGTILRAIEHQLDSRSDCAEWVDYTVFAARS